MGQEMQNQLLGERLESHLIELEQSLHLPPVRANPAVAGALLAEDFREFGASGRVWSRAEILQALASEAPTEFMSEDFICQQLSPELVLLTYKSTHLATSQSSLRSSLWRLEDRRWRLVFHQGTPIR
jgi:glyoxylase I family protein